MAKASSSGMKLVLANSAYASSTKTTAPGGTRRATVRMASSGMPTPVGLFGLVRNTTRVFGVFHDDPAAVPTANLRATACITVDDDWRPSGELVEERLGGGRYARTVHTGSYAELKSAYDWLYRNWLPTSHEEPRNQPCIEEYLNDARQVAAKDLETAVMLPLEN